MNDMTFVQTDAKAIRDNMINGFETALGETLYPGDERRMFLEQQAAVIVGLENDINESAKQNLLRYARGEKLDAMGERVNTPRLRAQKAMVTLRFSLSGAQAGNVTIPAGTRVTADGLIYFATRTPLTIQAGETAGEVAAQSLEEGRKYNGFVAGQINKLVDPIPYVAGVTNTDTSSEGTDMEPDDDGVNVWSGYRERIRQAPASFSTAGPEDAYIYWAKTANQDIADIAVTSPSPGEIRITVLMKDGELPSQAVLDAVLKACNARHRRPLSDHVTVSAPTANAYDISFTYYISRDRATEETVIREEVERAVGQYAAWQAAKLGRAINPDCLRQLVFAAGAFRMDLLSPAYAETEQDGVALPGTVTMDYGGLI